MERNMTKPNPSIELMKFRSSSCNERALRAEAAAYAAGQVVRFFKQLANAYRHRRQIAAVALLDDRTLKDIGLSHAELQSAARQPLWAFKPLVRRCWDGASDRSPDGLARVNDRETPDLSEIRRRRQREHDFHASVG
jgi:uncharacterized protein YjiS (DUF1127 family)